MIHEQAAPIILEWLHRTEDALVGKTVLTFNGEAGTCRGVRLDPDHGLCFTIDIANTGFALQYEGPGQRWYPVSTIRSVA